MNKISTCLHDKTQTVIQKPCDIFNSFAPGRGSGHFKSVISEHMFSGECHKNPFNTLRPRRNEQHFADDIFKRIFSNENVWISIEISLKFVPKSPINNIPALVQIMAWRRWGDKPLSEPMMVSLPTHICVTRPQWVNGKSALLQVMAWCCQATIHHLSQCWPRALLRYGATRPQWDKLFTWSPNSFSDT